MTFPLVPQPTSPSLIVTGAASTAAVAHGFPVGSKVAIAATAAAYITFGGSGVAAAASTAHTFQVHPGLPLVVELDVAWTHHRAIQVSAAGVVTITPLKN